MQSARAIELVITKRKRLALLALLLSWSVGIGLVLWALLDSSYRDAEGNLQNIFLLLFAVSIALISAGWAVYKGMARFAFWLALAIVGQAVALQLIEAGNSAGYQHYKPIDRLISETHTLLLIFLLLLALLVGFGLKSHWPTIQGWFRKNFKLWQLAGIGLLIFLSSATVSQQISIYVGELIIASTMQVVNLVVIVLMVWSIPQGSLDSFNRIIGRLFNAQSANQDSRPVTIDRFTVLAAIWVILLAALLSYFSYQRHPHIPDEVMYLYQARYLLEGKFTVAAPPVPEAFSFYLVPYQASRWYSIFPPGWPAILAVGVWLGAPWLVNPLLAGLNIILAYFLLREFFDLSVTRLIVLLLAFSPWFVFMGMNFMAHTFTLTCALVAANSIVQVKRTGKLGWTILAGIAVGVVSLIRPLDGLIVAGLLGLWALGMDGKRLSVKALFLFVISAAATGALVLPYNNQVTGEPTSMPLTNYYEEYFGPKKNALGFGPERGLGWAIDPFDGHSPRDALINANLNIFSLNIELLGWVTGSLILIAILIFAGGLRRIDYFLLGIVVLIAGLYSLYWFSGGPDFGARYWWLMLLPLMILTARGVVLLGNMITNKAKNSNNINTRVMLGVIILCFLTLVNFFPWRAIDKYHQYRGMQPGILSVAAEYSLGESLVLIRGNDADYESAWIYNPLDPYAPAPIYAWDKNLEVRNKLLHSYIERPVWIVEGPSITQSGYHVIAGPVPASELLDDGTATN